MASEVLDGPVLHDALKHVVFVVVRVKHYLLLSRQLLLLLQYILKEEKKSSMNYGSKYKLQPRLKATALCFKEQHHHQNPQNVVYNVGKFHPNGASMIMNGKKIC